MLVVKRISLIAAGLLFLAFAATPANNSEQVIFSTPGFCCMPVVGNANGVTSTPFGFWLWCAAEAAPPSRGPYQNFNACQGNMYFYALDHNAKPIIGFIQEIPPDSGQY